MTAGRLKIWNEDAGEWEYPPGANGTVSEITSTDMSVTITNPEGPTVDLSASGGSQPGTVRRLTVDLTAADMAEGPVTLYTPDAGEVVGPVYLYDVVFSNGSQSICIGRDEQVASQLSFPALAAWDSDLSRDGAGFAAKGAQASSDLGQIPLTTGAVTAGFTGDGDILSPAAGGWQAGHVYAQFDHVIAAGHVWECDPGGTSGGSKPDFAGHIGGTVTDGADIVWSDFADVTVGSATVSFDVCTPAAP